MKKSNKANAAQARTAAKVKQQPIDWKRVVTVGIDLGDRFSHFCALADDGSVVAEGRVATTPGAVELLFKISRKRIAMEAGTHSPWMSRLLTRLGHEVIVANSRKLRLIYENQHKSDRVDAEYLARVARLDPKLLGAIEHRSEVGQCHLSLIRARDTLVRSRARLIQHVRSAIKSLGERIPSGTAEAFHKRASSSIPEGLREALLPLVAVIEQLTARIKEYDRKVEQLAEDRYPDTAALTQVCGVGSLTALAYILTLEDEQRYRRSRSVGAWLGLVPGQHDSGESQPQRRITKEGDAYLRRLLVGCAQYILGPFAADSDLRRHGLLIAARGGSNAKKRAVVAVARKLAVLLHHLWRTREVYEPLHNAGEQDAAA
ncbi:MAG TPA: IS110 family transposase [Sphingomicrobium sp.]|nr:IS110 family transposase [Sphingomicrobium sp.]